MRNAIRRVMCGAAMLALSLGTVTAVADDDDVEDVIVVTGTYDPLLLFGLGILFGGEGTTGGGAPETGPQTNQDFCHSEEDQDSVECQEDEED